MGVPCQNSGLVQKASLLLREGVEGWLRGQTTAGDIIGDAFGEARDVLIELYARDAEGQMASADRQCLSEQVAGGVLNIAEAMTRIDQLSSPHEAYPVVPAM